METAKGKTREEIINRLADRIDSFEKYNQPHSRLLTELATQLLADLVSHIQMLTRLLKRRCFTTSVCMRCHPAIFRSRVRSPSKHASISGGIR